MLKRSRILVDPKVQWAIGRRIFGHWILFVCCLLTINVAVRVFATVVTQPFGEAFEAAVSAQTPILVVMFVLLPIFIRDTMVLSNRFAGPMYRLRTALAALAQGNTIRPIQFRKGDFWIEVPGDFNTVRDEMESLRAKNQQLACEISQLRREAANV